MASWSEFNSERNKEFEKLYSKLKITLYGSYFPTTELELLERMKDYLISKGFIETNIVTHYQSLDGNLSAAEVSKRCIIFSDVNFFIITKDGNKLGVTRELAYLVDDTEAKKKQEVSTIFDDLVTGESTLSTLSLDDIEELRLPCKNFIGEDSLRAALYAEAIFYTRKLRHILQSRP